MKDYNNCLRPSLISDLYSSPQDLLVDFSRPMPLHLKLRNGNQLLLLLRKSSVTVYDDLLELSGFVPEKYYQELEGGPLNKLLDAATHLPMLIGRDVQRTLEVEEDTMPLSHLRKHTRRGPRLAERDKLNRCKQHPAAPFNELFVSLKDLLQFVSHRKLHPMLDNAAHRYRMAIDALGCKPTVMMHIIVDEVPRFCERHGRGLGDHSKQASESMHYEEKKFERRWHVPAVGTSGHGEQLMLSTCGLNAAHLLAWA